MSTEDLHGDGRDGGGDAVTAVELDDLSLDLTDALRGVEGVVEVLDARPVVVAAITAVADGIDGGGPRGLVDVTRTGGVLTVAASVATDVGAPTPATLARVAAVLRDRAVRHLPGTEVVVSVTSRVIEAPLPR
jgi:hypothetical protein